MLLVRDGRRLWSRWVAWSRHSPGALICHPVALASLIVLVANDHLLKGLAPGVVTGKLSDIAGLVYFPLLVVAVLELVRRRSSVAARRDVLAAAACLVTAIAFVSIKTIPAATGLFNEALGWAQWVVGGGVLAGAPLVPTRGVTDPSDLVALPGLFVAFGVAGLRVGRTTSRPSRRLSALSLATIFVAGLASIATSPAMRSSSTDYEEAVQLTRDAPAVTRHLSLDIANRDAKLDSLDLVANAYSTGADRGQFETPGVLVTLVPDDVRGTVTASPRYLVPALTLFDACKTSCHEGVTVVVRLTDPELAAAGPIATNLKVDLFARASEEGTGAVDIDLGLVNDADRAFQGAPAVVAAQRSGSAHVGADAPQFQDEFDIVIAAAALQPPYGYPLIGEIAVWHDNKTAAGHPNALSSGFEFDSPLRPPDAHEYGWVSVGIGWLDEPLPPATVINLLPLCEADAECRIHASLTSIYEAYVNDPSESGASPVRGLIDFDWHVEVRLLTFDGRVLPEGPITFEPAG